MSSARPSIAETLARFVTGCDYGAIPGHLREKARRHLLDSVGVALASSGFEFARRAYAGFHRFGAGEFAVIGMPGKLALRDAVCMNGILVHGIEYDDTSIIGRIHPSASCAPAALGVGAFGHASGEELLAAYVLGLECAIRIGAAAQGGFSPAGFNATGVVGGFGAVITAGKLLGLSAERLASAQGLAYSMVAGNREFSTGDAWTKRLDPAWAAVGGVTAAMLASEGYVGPLTPYEGKYGLYRVYLDRSVDAEALEAVTAGLGERWYFAHLALKSLPSCYFNHPIIHSTLALVTQHDLKPAAIERICVRLPAAAIDTVCEPRAAKVAPGDTASALFSAYYNVASAAVRRRHTLDDLQPAALRDPAVLALANKVSYAIDERSNFPRHYSGAVDILTTDGRTLSAREDINKGSVELPLSETELERKFMANAERALARSQAEALRDVLLGIDRIADVRSLVLSGPH